MRMSPASRSLHPRREPWLLKPRMSATSLTPSRRVLPRRCKPVPPLRTPPRSAATRARRKALRHRMEQRSPRRRQAIRCKPCCPLHRALVLVRAPRLRPAAGFFKASLEIRAEMMIFPRAPWAPDGADCPWLRWFAWFPVVVDVYQPKENRRGELRHRVWLRWVECRLSPDGPPPNDVSVWQFRLPQEAAPQV